MCKFGILILGEVGKFHASRFVPREWVGSPKFDDRILSNAQGAEPPRDAKDSVSARSHSTYLETSSSDRP